MATLWVDNAILILMVIYTVAGLLRGASREFYALITWLIGIGVGWFFSKNFSIFFLKIFSSPSIRMAASFAVLLGLTLFVGGVIRLLAGSSVKKNAWSFLDHLGGIILGPVHGLMAVFVLVLIAGFTPLPKDRWWHESAYIPYFQAIVVQLKSLTSSDVAKFINYPSSLKLQVK